MRRGERNECRIDVKGLSEVNKDAFLAVRDAFDLARLWLAECRSAS